MSKLSLSRWLSSVNTYLLSIRGVHPDVEESQRSPCMYFHIYCLGKRLHVIISKCSTRHCVEKSLLPSSVLYCHSVQTHPAESATPGGAVDPVRIHISLHIQWASFESFLGIFITTISMTWRIMTRESNTNSLARIEFTSVFIKRPHILPTHECLSHQWSVNYILDCVGHQSVSSVS